MDNYYECKRCSYKCKQSCDMKKHLNKINKCVRNASSYKYEEEELYNLSLQKHISDYNDNDKNFKCDKCKKIFSTKWNLLRHGEKACKEKVVIFENKNIEEHINNNTNSNNITNIINGNNNIINSNITQNINIHINSFDKPWSTNHINDFEKFIILCNKNNYTKALEKILENDVNLNVLIDKHNDYGLVYKNNKLIPMDMKELIRRIFGNLTDNLLEFVNDIKKSDDDNINVDIIKVDEISQKHNDFLNNKNNYKDNAKNLISNIYDNKRVKTSLLLGSINKENDKVYF